MTLIDSHCHLHYDYSPKTTEDLVREARDAGVLKLMTVGTDLAAIASIQDISSRFENVFHTVGVHPHDVEKTPADTIEVLREAAKHPKCRAIGEIGLDFYYEHSPREIQKDWLKRQLDLALELGLPVVIHARDAEPELLPLLQAYAQQFPKGVTHLLGIPGVIHCFTGTLPFARACIDAGFLISFSGILTFKNSAGLREVAKALPLDRLLVETDCPYLAPIPYRGKKCEPAMVLKTAECLAQVHGVSLEKLAEITTKNAEGVFGI